MDEIPLGKIVGTDDLFCITVETRRQHAYLIGKTGGGKSTMLESMVYSDITNGRPFCVIDPHGSLTKKIADAVGDRANDTILFDPLSEHPQPVYNPCFDDSAKDIATVVDYATAALEHVHTDAWGPRMEDCLKNALTLAVENRLSFADVPRILTDDDFRSSLTCNNPAVSDYWSGEYAGYSDQFRDQVISPILNKLRVFSSNPIVKRVMDGPSTLDIPAIMGNPVRRPDGSYRRRKPKILLVSLSKRMGAKNAHVLGSLIVSRIAQAALERETLPEELWDDFTLYIDEFQNFTSEAMAEILAEARKYKLNLVLCHQYRDQIRNPNLREAALASTSTLVVFRVGTTDAETFARELGLKDLSGVYRPDRLTTLPNYAAYAKTMDGKYPTDAVLIETIPQALPTGSLNRVQKGTARRYTTPASKQETGGAKCASASSTAPKHRASSRRRRTTPSRRR